MYLHRAHVPQRQPMPFMLWIHTGGWRASGDWQPSPDFAVGFPLCCSPCAGGIHPPPHSQPACCRQRPLTTAFRA
ncbi:hypothetical protein LY78DRAFT_402816 [Colletotrichum sublineola]|nr:hypothetical protein LY78DRAFT_402816 [Colletotrichum sublineola]